MAERIKLDPRARTFLICAIALAYPMGSAGFELGAFGQLFYVRKLTAWAMVTGALVALTLLPRSMAPVSRWHLVVLAIPSVWLFLATVLRTYTGGTIEHPVLFSFGLLTYLVCLPYAVILVVEIVNPDLLNLEGWQPKAGLVLIAGLFVSLGYLGGARNDLFLSCEEFIIAGDEPPPNCRQVLE